MKFGNMANHLKYQFWLACLLAVWVKFANFWHSKILNLASSQNKKSFHPKIKGKKYEKSD